MHTYNNDTFINTAQIAGYTAITLAYCMLQKTMHCTCDAMARSCLRRPKKQPMIADNRNK